MEEKEASRKDQSPADTENAAAWCALSSAYGSHVYLDSVEDECQSLPGDLRSILRIDEEGSDSDEGFIQNGAAAFRITFLKGNNKGDSPNRSEDSSGVESGAHSRSDSSSNKPPKCSLWSSLDRRRWLTLITLALANFTSYLSMSVIAPFFPLEAQTKGMSLEMTGYVFSLYAFVIFIISPFLAKVIQDAGAKTVFICGVLLAGGSNVMFGFLFYLPSGFEFTLFCYLLRGLEAVGAACFFTSSCTLIADVFYDHISSVFGLMETFTGLGMSLGPAIGGLLYSIGGFQLPFVVLGSLLLLVVPFSIIVLPSTINKEVASGDSPLTLLKLVKIPSVMIMYCVVVIICCNWSFIDPILQPHMAQFQLSPELVGLLFLATSVMYGVGSPVLGHFVDKWKCEPLIILLGLLLTSLTFLVMGPTPLLPSLPSNLWLTASSLTFLGIPVSMGLIPTFQLVLKCVSYNGFEDNIATFSVISGLFSSANSLGDFLGPALAGVLYEKYTFEMSTTIMACITFAVAVVFLAFMVTTCCVESAFHYATADEISDSEDNTKEPLKVPRGDERRPLLYMKQRRPSRCPPLLMQRKIARIPTRRHTESYRAYIFGSSV